MVSPPTYGAAVERLRAVTAAAELVRKVAQDLSVEARRAEDIQTTNELLMELEERLVLDPEVLEHSLASRAQRENLRILNKLSKLIKSPFEDLSLLDEKAKEDQLKEDELNKVKEREQLRRQQEQEKQEVKQFCLHPYHVKIIDLVADTFSR